MLTYAGNMEDAMVIKRDCLPAFVIGTAGITPDQSVSDALQAAVEKQSAALTYNLQFQTCY